MIEREMYNVFAMDACSQWLVWMQICLTDDLWWSECLCGLNALYAFVQQPWDTEIALCLLFDILRHLLLPMFPVKGEGADIPSGHISMSGSAYLDMSGQRLDHLDQISHYII